MADPEVLHNPQVELFDPVRGSLHEHCIENPCIHFRVLPSVALVVAHISASAQLYVTNGFKATMHERKDEKYLQNFKLN